MEVASGRPVLSPTTPLSMDRFFASGSKGNNYTSLPTIASTARSSELSGSFRNTPNYGHPRISNWEHFATTLEFDFTLMKLTTLWPTCVRPWNCIAG
jgi:hypothetical protein